MPSDDVSVRIAVTRALAVAWSRRVRRASRSPAKWGSGRLALGISSVMAAAFRWLGITARNDILEKAPHVLALEGRQVLACWHPHGLYTIAPLVFHSPHPRNKNSPIYSFATAVASVVFQVPIFRELLLLFDCRAADSKVIDGLLHSGRSVFVCPGGIHEQLETDPEQEQIFFPSLASSGRRSSMACRLFQPTTSEGISSMMCLSGPVQLRGLCGKSSTSGFRSVSGGGVCPSLPT